MVDSIHVARWISQFEPSEVEFTLFPSTPNRRVHSLIKELMVSNGNIKIVPFGGKLSILLWGLDLVFSNLVRGYLLRRFLIKQSPDFLHALEFQHAGYIALRALANPKIKTPFIATNYGSDIFWFQRFPRHKKRLKRLLRRADYYSGECSRDIQLAKNLGFSGHVLPIIPNAGLDGFAKSNEKELEGQSRGIILIKGYDNWVGRGINALKALTLISDEIGNYKLVIYSANLRTMVWARFIAPTFGLEFTVFGKNTLRHDKLQNLMANSKLHIAVSLSDGISTSTLEALSNGAIVLQSDTSCIGEWWSEGVNGFFLRSSDPRHISTEIINALSKGKNNQQNKVISKLAALRGKEFEFYEIEKEQNAKKGI